MVSKEKWRKNAKKATGKKERFYDKHKAIEKFNSQRNRRNSEIYIPEIEDSFETRRREKRGKGLTFLDSKIFVNPIIDLFS